MVVFKIEKLHLKNKLSILLTFGKFLLFQLRNYNLQDTNVIKLKEIIFYICKELKVAYSESFIRSTANGESRLKELKSLNTDYFILIRIVIRVMKCF